MNTAEKIKLADKIVELLESRFSFLGYKFGIDPLVGLIPVLGDIIPALLSLYLVWVAYTEGLGISTIVKMLLLILVDILIGSIPILGDVTDFIFRAHTKNLQILKDEMRKKYGEGEPVVIK